jgi:hypothetical protein
MKSSEKQHLKKLLDQIKPQEPAANFEQLIHQDWQRTIAYDESTHRLSEVLTVARLNPKLLTFLVIVAITGSVLLGQHLMSPQDDDLHRIDALSELSLSTI